MTLVIHSRKAVFVPKLGAIDKGISVLTYNSSSHHWTDVTGVSGALQTRLSMSHAFLSEPLKISVHLHNTGTLPRIKRLQVMVDGKVIATPSISVLGGDGAQVSVPWTPEQAGQSTVTVKYAKTVLITKGINVRAKGRIGLLSQVKAITFGGAGLVSGIVMALLMALVLLVWKGGNQVATKR